MIVLNKKRISIVILSVVVSVFTFMLTTEENMETIDTTSIPVSTKTIVVDAGHGKPDEGDFELKL